MEYATIARPYAEAIFRLSEDGNSGELWSDMLEFIAQLAKHPQVQSLISNPQLTTKEVEGALSAIAESRLNDAGKKLVSLLLENGRMVVAPQIQEIFETLRAARLGEMDALIVSAYALNDAQLAELVTHLERRFKRKIKAHVTLDPDMIGGIKVQVGDVVIDGTVRSKLDNMATTLKL